MSDIGVSPHRLVAAITAALVVLSGIVVAHTTPAQATAVPSGFSEQVVFGGLVHPTNVEFAADGRVFVAEKSGIIKVFDSLADTSPSVFADLRTKVHNYWDRGLLGFALHPNFPTDPRMYVLYTYDGLIGGRYPKWGTAGATSDPCPTPPGPTSDGCQVSGRLSVLTQSGSTVAEQVMIEDWCQQFPSHSIGSLAFGPDGMLYATGGDGASFSYTDYGQDGYTASDVTPDNPCGDPPSPVGTALAPPSAEGGALRSQDLRTSADPVTLDGSLIRIDPNTGFASPDNPQAGSSDPNARRIVAYGLRNPFRFAVRPGTNEVWIGDVGWNGWEEINRVVVSPTAGVSNFGWPCYEGSGRQPGYERADLRLCQQLYAAGSGAVKAPYYAYHHNAKVVSGETCGTGSSSISGLAFYPGGNYPSGYRGALFFADYSRKCVWAMRPGAGGLPDQANIVTFATGYGVTGLRAGPGGDIFAVDYDNGRIVRYVYSATNNPPTAQIKAEPTSGLAPLTVAFDARSSHDADGDPLTYAWDLDGDGQYDDSTSPTVQHTYTTNGRVVVGLQVTDSKGARATATATISVGNTAPTATITGPSPGTTWRVGDTIGFSGTAVDPQDGTLPASALTWTLIMHHCPSNCHAHQITTTTGTSGTFTTPDHEYPSYLELRLTAEDSGGLSDTKSVRLDPKTADLTFASSPSRLRLTYLAGTARAPFTRRAIVRSSGSISAGLIQVRSDKAYRFATWSDGGARTHNITTPASARTYTASYRVKRDLAQGRPVRVSSSKSGYEGSKAVDGSMSTRWLSASSDPQWLRVDLGMTHRVNRVLLNWDAAYGKTYRIQVSTDGSTWRTVYSTTTGNGGTDHITFSHTAARYVRVYGTARATSSGYSLWEIGVFGDIGIITGVGGKCVDVARSSTADGSKILLWGCHGGANQRWTQHEDGSLRTMGKCLDARRTTNGSATVLWTCNGTGGQKWIARTDGSLFNPRSGRCLDAESGSSANGTRLIIWNCHGKANQRWVVP
ncbi:MAG TPA: ricin-type beta-trefoil lectin domain protein [Jiangellaceae bacterium]